MKNLTKIIAVILVFAAVLCSACACVRTDNYVVSIEQQTSNSYKVTYRDGTTKILTVNTGEGANGKDGRDGKDLTIQDVYQKYLAEVDPNATYQQFLEKFLTFSSDNTAVVGQCLLSSMKVYSEFRYTYRTITGGWMRPGTTTTVKSVGFSQGSAVIYKMDSDYTYILTNYHVVYYSGTNEDNNGGSKIANKIYCYLYGSEMQPYPVVNAAGNAYETDSDGYTRYNYGSGGILCQFVGGSMTEDLAVLKASTADILAINPAAKVVELADGYCVGQAAIAVGNTEGEGISVTQGIVSVDSEAISYDIDDDNKISDYEYYRVLRIDTAIYSGNSGGGLFNNNGQLIGITNAGDTSDENINYAIPVGIVRLVADNILGYQGSPRKMTLGVEVVSANSKYVFDATLGQGQIEENVVVASVASSSVANTLGLAQNDVLLSVTINGTTHNLTRAFQLSDLMYGVRAGDVISFAYKRGGTTAQTSSHTVTTSDLTVVI